jgi:outer membrane protein OmpA-like peptidoglycan-associated protein
MVRAVRNGFILGCALAIAGAAHAQAAAETQIIVFFDWAKPDISRDAAEILDKVAADYSAKPGKLLLSGHSDRSGPAGANLRSSRKRAAAVRDYLAAHGVPATAMTVRAYGEERPIIPTEDGVREVQNRRVEISIVPAS